MPKFPVKPLDDESYRALVLKLARSEPLNYKEVESLIAYVAMLKAGKGN